MKRLAIIKVPHSYLFFHFFATPVDGKVELRMPTLVHPSTGKPIKWQDCKVISVHCDFPYEAVLFKLSSEEFDIVGEGERIPFVDFAIEERHVKVVDDPYPPLGLHENYCGYQVATAVFSSSVEGWKKKCEEQDDRKVNVGCMECGLEGGHKTSCKIGLQIARNQIGDEFTDITSRIIRRESK